MIHEHRAAIMFWHPLKNGLQARRKDHKFKKTHRNSSFSYAFHTGSSKMLRNHAKPLRRNQFDRFEPICIVWKPIRCTRSALTRIGKYFRRIFCLVPKWSCSNNFQQQTHTIGSLARKRIIKHSCATAFRAETVAFVKNVQNHRDKIASLKSARRMHFNRAKLRICVHLKKCTQLLPSPLASAESTRFRGHTIEMDRMNYSWQFDAFQLNLKLFIPAFVCTLAHSCAWRRVSCRNQPKQKTRSG